MSYKDTFPSSDKVEDIHPQSRGMVPEPTADADCDLKQLSRYFPFRPRVRQAMPSPERPGFRTL